VTADGSAGIIELADVTKLFRQGEISVEALRGVSVVVRKGEFLAITGPSGSGKTTLLAILGLLERPTTGSYRLVGEEMASLNETGRAHVRGKRIGFVFQAYNLLPRSTALENVELPLVYAGVSRGERSKRALDALGEVGLSERALHRPSRLSGGEQQRVAIARALVIRPSVVLLDEPTGNLDSASAEQVLAILEQAHRGGATIVMVTHSTELAERASRNVRLADGLVGSDEPTARPYALGGAAG
jgi:putative ABC transport system ATP-binding protein